MMSQTRDSAWRAAIDLARAGNFPSVASNVLAALVLSSTNHHAWPDGAELVWALAGGWLAYAGGATLNEVFDERFDAQRRPERAIPRGVISRAMAGWLGGIELALGVGLFLIAGAAATWAVALLATILAYNWIHKRWAGAVLLMAGCRVLLALTVASLPGNAFTTPLQAWVAGLFVYIVVLSVIARREYREVPRPAAQGPSVARLLSFIPLIDAIALLLVGAWLPAMACAAAIPLGRWTQRLAAST